MAGYDAVSISPIYGWVEGCTTVRVSGHGFADDASVKIGDLSLDISARGTGLDRGYWVEGTLPPDPVTGAGYATVTVTSDGNASSIEDAFYYVACLQPGNLESLDTETAVAGQTIGMAGCALDPATLTVELVSRSDGSIARAPFTSTCGSATARFVAPDLPDGLYDLQLVDAARERIFPPYLCPITDTADTAAALLWCPTLTYGVGQ